MNQIYLKGQPCWAAPLKSYWDKTRSLGFAQNARYFGAARWADALREPATIGFFHVSGEFTLGFALNAIRLAGIAFLGHGSSC